MILQFVGDVMLGRLVNRQLKSVPPRYPWGDTLPLFESADARICNLECVIADSGMKWSKTPKVFHFRSDAKNVQVLKVAGIDFVSLANNHTLDYGYGAMFEMLAILDRVSIHRAGAGKDIDEAARPAIFSRDGLRIGCISFTDNERPWEATSSEAGVFYLPVDLNDERARRLLNIVEETKSQVDLLVVCAHWGPNWGYRPQSHHIPFAHALVERGADIIFGHSCHVFQGIELYQNRPILYSCGDFVDDYRVDERERNDESFVFQVDVEDGRIRGLRLYPAVIREFQARRAEGEKAERIAGKMRTLCEQFGTPITWNESERRVEIPVL